MTSQSLVICRVWPCISYMTSHMICFSAPFRVQKSQAIFQMLLAKTCFMYCIALLGVRAIGSNVLMKARDTLVCCPMFCRAVVGNNLVA